MPATPERIAFVTKPFRLATAGPDAGVVAAYGTKARTDDADDPAETFFAATADADAMADERLALLSASRRRFPTTLANGADFALDLDNSQTVPVAQVIDPRGDADLPALITKVRVDLATGKTSVEAWG